MEIQGGEQNLAVTVHMLENLLAANVAHGKKLVALILSFPESQSDEGGPESPEPAVPTARHVGVLCLLVQLDVACTVPCIAPAITLHNVSISQNRFCTELNSISVELQLFKIYLWCYAKGHLHYRSSPSMWPSTVKNSCTDFVTRQTENHTV